ncbi:hypothetical protein [Thiomicrorhabdus sp. 6S3-12]|uniref:hypothetical protein n=1 Tax=Thiomicrorhabdus sp. 6S3-12 TaxID=2819681 RepID=UPI001AAC8573|nr:hypothetical protein [Thiomicrorhabdus sp. 6S3-12]MBO1923790.1 hypothetical protein [Thiomicrorhabdus sp. 6S3-12]
MEPFSEKTFREFIKGNISSTMRNRLALPDIGSAYDGGLPEKGFFIHIIWKSLLLDFRQKSPRDYFLLEIERLLAEESNLLSKCVEQQGVELQHRCFWASKYAFDFAILPYGECRIPFIEEVDRFASFGSLSMLLHIIAAHEISLKDAFGLKITDESVVDQFVPDFKDGQVVWPLKKLALYWQAKYGVTSIDKLAEKMPSLFGTEAANRTTRLKTWLSGKHLPRIETLTSDDTISWIKGFMGDASKQEVLSEILRLYIAIGLQGMLRYMRKPYKGADVKSWKPGKGHSMVFKNYSHFYVQNYKNYMSQEQN